MVVLKLRIIQHIFMNKRKNPSGSLTDISCASGSVECSQVLFTNVNPMLMV